MTDSEPRKQTTPRAWWIAILLLLALVAGVGYVMFFGPPAPYDYGHGATFVRDADCVSCHQQELEKWKGSHHDLAMDHASSDTMLGDFSDVTLEHQGVTSRFFKKDGRFYVNTDGPDGKMADFEVKYTFGVVPLQQYLVELENGRVQCLQVSWDTEKGRWIGMQDEPIPHGDALHWTGMQFNWNFMCAECHSTDLQRHYDPETNGYNTTWVEINVGCQACHGPGSSHVAWGRRVQDADETKWAEDDPKGLIMDLAAKDSLVQIEHCARCHARRNIVQETYEYGVSFLDLYDPRLLIEPLYHADGQILDEVYVYGSLLQAKKYRHGVRCTDCHDAHSARLLEEGNALCVRCHQENPPEQFPSIRKLSYDTKEHHFHEQGKPGSFCVDCHMEAKTYMKVDPRRDHSFRIPRPDLTESIGVPNACDTCHLKDHPTSWSTEAIKKWFPKTEHPLHYGEIFTLARAGRPEAQRLLPSLFIDPEVSDIVRATAIHYMARYAPAEVLPSVVMMLGDDSALVRASAVATIGTVVPRRASPALMQQKAKILAPILADPIRLVRTEAARVLSDVPAHLLPEADRDALAKAMVEFLARQEAHADRPDGHLNLAVLHEVRSELKQAEAEYRRALELDENFAPARFNLATLLNGQGRNGEAEEHLLEITKRQPANGEGWYSLGLIRAERKNLKGAAEALARAVQHMPGRARVRYNYAIALQQLGNSAEAERILLSAYALAPRDPGILRALISIYARLGRLDRAEAFAERLVAVTPPQHQAEPKRLLKQIRQALRK